MVYFRPIIYTGMENKIRGFGPRKRPHPQWDKDEWVKQIWYYQNRKIINGMDPHTSLEDQLRSQYGNIHY